MELKRRGGYQFSGRDALLIELYGIETSGLGHLFLYALRF